eukprot:4177822-Pyramimonas_sp.AAC.1
MNRFEEIRRVRLSRAELGSQSAARTRSAKLFVLFQGGYSAGGHINRCEDIRGVCLSNRELGTRSAARTRSAKLF